MKKLATLSLLAAGALALVPKPAMARGDEALAALGGFIGGLIIGSNVNQSNPSTVVYASDCPPPPPAPVVIVDGECGYWRTSSVRVWVVPTWVIVYDQWNRPVRRYVAGHYEYRPHRVWVASSSRHNPYYRNDYDRRDYGRHDRGHREHVSDRRSHGSDRNEHNRHGRN